MAANIYWLHVLDLVCKFFQDISQSFVLVEKRAAILPATSLGVIAGYQNLGFKMKQLDLFPESVEDELRREMKLLKAQCDKLRKSQFARLGEMLKLYSETRLELQELKETLSRTNYV